MGLLYHNCCLSREAIYTAPIYWTVQYLRLPEPRSPELLAHPAFAKSLKEFSSDLHTFWTLRAGATTSFALKITFHNPFVG